MKFFVKCAYCGKIVRSSLALRLEGENEFGCLQCLVFMNNRSVYSLNNVLEELLKTLKNQAEEKIEIILKNNKKDDDQEGKEEKENL